MISSWKCLSLHGKSLWFWLEMVSCQALDRYIFLLVHFQMLIVWSLQESLGIDQRAWRYTFQRLHFSVSLWLSFGETFLRICWSLRQDFSMDIFSCVFIFAPRFWWLKSRDKMSFPKDHSVIPWTSCYLLDSVFSIVFLWLPDHVHAVSLWDSQEMDLPPRDLQFHKDILRLLPRFTDFFVTFRNYTLLSRRMKDF